MFNQKGLKFSEGEFRAPGVEYEICWLWTWNAPISREGIDSRLDEFLRAGIKSLYVLPLPKDFRPEYLRTFLDPEYLSEGYFELIEYAIRRATGLGMQMWIYDEGGWPSGGACFNTVHENPEAKMKVLAKREVALECDERFKPGDGHIALFDGKRRLTSDHISSRRVTLTEYYVREFVENGNRVDNTSLSATKTFINNTYEKYKERVGDLFGEIIPIMFTDEPGLLRESLALDEFEIFKQEYGYDLVDYIYAIDDVTLAVTEKEIQARIDHFKLLGKLFKKNTTKPLSEWCEKAGIYFSGHLDIDNRPWGGMAKGYFSHLDLLREFHVPGIDVIWHQIRYPHGGRAPVDDETLGFGFFPRFASSAARQRGRILALTESLAIYGDGVTPSEIRYAENYQLMRGINVFNFTALPYGKSRCAPFMMRPAFCSEKPGFYNLKHMNEYYARLSYLARLGEAEGDTALYIPCCDYAASAGALDDANVSFKAAGTELEEKNIQFDIIDDGGILEAEDTKDGLKLGDAVYRHIVVPACRYMPREVAEKIAPYLGEGEPIYAVENKSIRVMTRKLSEGRLYFFFNEGEATVCERLNIAGEGKLYRLSPECGEIYAAPEEITLECGEIAVILESDKDYNVVSDEAEYAVEVTDFCASEYDRFEIDYFGIKSVHEIGEITPDDSFSGTVYYVADYALPSEPQAGERYRLTLLDTEISAEICGKSGKICDVGMNPKRAIVDGECLERCGKLTIKVSNTSANEIREKFHIISSRPKAEVGMYNPKTLAFEAESPALKIGTLRIEKLK